MQSVNTTPGKKCWNFSKLQGFLGSSGRDFETVSGVKKGTKTAPYIANLIDCFKLEIIFSLRSSFLFPNRIRGSQPVSRVLSWTAIHLRQVSPPACSDLPESTAGHSYGIPIWSCSGWGLPSPRLLPAVRCALTAPFHPYRHDLVNKSRDGGFLSVALSMGSRPPGVTWHPALRSPDFPLRTGRSDRLADSGAQD